MILLVGDMLFFVVALWLTLLVRYLELPSQDRFLLHLEPFAVLTILWVSVFYVAGLYDKHTLFLKRALVPLILRTQVINFVLAALFFFLLPVFTIAPKTNLFIYLVISSLLISWWRVSLVHRLSPRKKYKALLIADGDEAEELVREVNGNSRYDFEFVRMLDWEHIAVADDLEQRVSALIEREGISVLIANPRSPEIAELLPVLSKYTFLQEGSIFLDFATIYEELFDRVPLSHLRNDWLLEHVSREQSPVYGVGKRVMDIAGALVMGVTLLVCMPVVIVLMRMEDRGPIFISQTRLGRYGRSITVYKIRTMKENDPGAWIPEGKNTVTRIGNVLRKVSIDELPQAWNILKGELSLIGPRSDIGELGVRLFEELPNYMVRYSITPGLTGWAQTNQRYSPGVISPQSIQESRERLAYDLYYVKHRSFILDVTIALKTIKTLLSRIGGLLGLR
jgi:lipopolysaccharide/colanic/teichoic acid biosynthesis glycosyltransferase